MPLYVRDWSFDVAHLSLEERGAYITIICEMWGRGGRLTYNKRALSVLLNVGRSKHKLDRILSSLIDAEPRLLTLENGYLIQRRLRAEYDKATARKTRALKGADGRWDLPEDASQASIKHPSKHPSSMAQAYAQTDIEHGPEHMLASAQADARSMHYPSTKHLAIKKQDVPTSGRSVDNPVDNSVLDTPGKPAKPKAAQPSTDDIVLADHLGQLIVQNNPDATAPTPAQVVKWARAIQLLREKDGHSAEKIRQVIDWCQNDEFWQVNVQSGDALREKWNQLTAKMRAGGSKAKAKPALVRGMEGPKPDGVQVCERCEGSGTIFVQGVGVQACPECKSAGATVAGKAV